MTVCLHFLKQRYSLIFGLSSASRRPRFAGREDSVLLAADRLNASLGDRWKIRYTDAITDLYHDPHHLLDWALKIRFGDSSILEACARRICSLDDGTFEIFLAQILEAFLVSWDGNIAPIG